VESDPHFQGHEASGPVDGTSGLIGTCGGIVVDGAWTCQLDEEGVVKHVIRD
jgi:hypothetical protein